MPTNTQRRTTRRASLSLPLAGALLAVTAGSALAQSPSTAPIGAIDHPTGSTDIVLSMEVGGGFVPFGYAMTQAPTFVLYGDNTGDFRPGSAAGGHVPALRAGGALPSSGGRTSSPYALSVGKLASAGDSYVDMQASDAPTTVFTIDAGGVDKAVGASTRWASPNPRVRTLRTTTRSVSWRRCCPPSRRRSRRATSSPREAYQPEQYRVVLSEVDPSMSVESVTWPWADLTLMTSRRSRTTRPGGWRASRPTS